MLRMHLCNLQRCKAQALQTENLRFVTIFLFPPIPDDSRERSSDIYFLCRR